MRQTLPEAVKPTLYRLVMEPCFEDFSYRGTVAIDVLVKSATRSVVLNSDGLEVTSARFSLLVGNPANTREALTLMVRTMEIN